MRSYPEYAPSVVKHLSSRGVDWDRVGCPHNRAKSEVPEHSSSPNNGMAKPVEHSTSEGSPSKAASMAEGPVEDDSVVSDRPDTLPSCYTEVRLLSAKVMKYYLKVAEPAVFSDHAIKAMAPMGRKAVRKEALLELFEFVFGLASDEAIAAAWHLPGAFAKHLGQVNERRTCLVRDLVLPPDWSQVGIYSLRRDGPNVFMSSKLLGHTMEIPKSYLSGVDLATIHVQVNYSERSAIVADASGVLRHKALILMLGGSRVASQIGGAGVDGGAAEKHEQFMAPPVGPTNGVPPKAETTDDDGTSVGHAHAGSPHTPLTTDKSFRPPLPADLGALVGIVEAETQCQSDAEEGEKGEELEAPSEAPPGSSSVDAAPARKSQGRPKASAQKPASKGPRSEKSSGRGRKAPAEAAKAEPPAKKRRK